MNDTTAGHHFGCTGTSMALKMEIESLGFELSTFAALDCAALDYLPITSVEFFDEDILANFLAHNYKLCALIQANDIVVINGQGSLHEVEREALAFLYIVYVAKTVFCKNVQIINHSVYPHDTSGVEDSDIISLYKKIYAVADFVAIREPLSAAFMRRIGLEVHDSFDCLPLYIKRYYQSNLCNTQNDLIVVAGVAALFNLNISTAGTQAGASVERGLMQMVKVLQLKMMEGYTVRFLYSDGSPTKEEQQMLYFLKSYMGKSFAVIHAQTIDGWLKTIEKADLLISGGFHHCIAAACLGTSFIALNSNIPNMAGLMKALWHPRPLIYSDLHLENKLRKAISKSAICTNSAHMLDKLCTRAQNNFAMLRKLSRF